MATPSSLSPSPVYRNKQGKKLEELYPKLKEKCPGIRVFYFNATGQHCDHGRQHNESWKTRLQDGKSLEAGTVVALIDFGIPGAVQEQHHGVAIQWDCGFVRVYSRVELADIRVFDLGPAGEPQWKFDCQCQITPLWGRGM